MPANHELLHSLQFGEPTEMPGGKYTKVVAKDPSGKDAGELQWNAKSNVIYSAWTRPDLHRQGVASHVLNHVQDNYATDTLSHSPKRTADGEAWTATTGHPRPKNEF